MISPFRLGILGSGQLGRMIALAAAELGISSHIFAPDADTGPAGQIAAATSRADYEDERALAEFAAAVDAVVCEFENVPAATLSFLARHLPVSPGAKALETAQSRRAEKSLAAALDIAVPRFWPVDSAGQLAAAMAALDGPGLLKTDRLGYDGKGQLRLSGDEPPVSVWQESGAVPAVLEEMIDFQAEASFLLARDAAGAVIHFPASLNEHKSGILARSVAPAPLDETWLVSGRQACEKLAVALDVTGLLAVEFFVGPAGQLLFNEIAPRPHNSFHWTIEGCQTSQFAQLVRVMAGMGFGATGMTGQTGRWQMINLLGEDMPGLSEHLASPGRYVHLYGKAEARPGRKMGHVSWPLEP